MSPAKSKLGAGQVFSVVREVRRGAGDPRPLAIAGAPNLVPLLARELAAGGDAAAVVTGRVEGAALLVWIGDPDESALHEAGLHNVPIVAVTESESVPYVQATDIVRVPPGSGFPLEEITVAIARRLGENATGLAARLPVLRPAVSEQLIRMLSRRNALIAAAVFIPGVDMPVLTLNQIRLVLRLALAHGEEFDRLLAFELLGVVGAGFGLRAVARELLDLVPVGGFLIKAGIAYTGTRAIGEAAVRYFESKQ
jgi:uncharacterized protein (DUF697 family)